MKGLPLPTWGLLALMAMPASPAVAQPADGLYLMTRSWIGSLEMDVYYFRGGGVARAPTGTGPDFTQSPAAAKGTYRMQGRQMAIRWSDGRTEEAEFEPSDRCFRWDARLFCPVKPFAKGARIGGEFAVSSGGGGVAQSLTISLTPDGSYRLRGFLGISPPAPGRSSTGVSTHQGTYELSGTALTLRPEGGQPMTAIAFPYTVRPGVPEPEYLYFNGGMLRRQ